MPKPDPSARTRKLLHAIELPAAELAVRIAEAMNQVRRPAGATAEQAIAGMRPEDQAAYLRAAKAVAIFFGEQVAKSCRVQ